MDMKKILQALDTASTKPVEGSNDMKTFVSIVTEGANPHKVALPVQMAMQHYQEEATPTVSNSASMLKKYFQEAEEIISQEKAERKEHLKMYASKVAKRVLENRYRSYHDELSSRERDEQNQMDWEKRDFKRREMEHELGDEEEYYQQQVNKDRGPWYLRINGKILKSQGEAKVFDWKKGANSYALAIIKNKPELQGKIMLTKRPQDDVEAKEGISDIAQQAWTGIKGFTGGLNPEDIAKRQDPSGDAMRKLLAFKADPRYASDQNAQKQIQMRIDDLTNRINLDKGMPVDAQGNPKQVVPPEQFKE
jgi:hypothetical protein